MKIRKIILATALLTSLLFTSCEKAMKPDTPLNISWLMKLAIDLDDYEQFNNLFTQGRKDTISEELFDAMRTITTSRTVSTTYQLLTFENGEMLLVRITPEEVEGEYRIEDIINVPEEMKEVFK